MVADRDNSQFAHCWAQWQSDAKFRVISISKSSICQCPESRWEQITNLYLCCSEGLSMKSFLLDCQVLRWSKCKRCSENIELKYLSSAGEREDVRTKYNSTHYYKLALTGLKPSKLAANRFYFSLVSRDTILNQRLISRELLPRLPSCQPRRQPALVKLLACVSWRGNYLLSRHSIYRYLQYL